MKKCKVLLVLISFFSIHDTYGMQEPGMSPADIYLANQAAQLKIRTDEIARLNKDKQVRANTAIARLGRMRFNTKAEKIDGQSMINVLKDFGLTENVLFQENRMKQMIEENEPSQISKPVIKEPVLEKKEEIKLITEEPIAEKTEEQIIAQEEAERIIDEQKKEKKQKQILEALDVLKKLYSEAIGYFNEHNRLEVKEKEDLENWKKSIIDKAAEFIVKGKITQEAALNYIQNTLEYFSTTVSWYSFTPEEKIAISTMLSKKRKEKEQVEKPQEPAEIEKEKILEEAKFIEAKVEQERLEKERLEKERVEEERIKKELLEKEKIEKERSEEFNKLKGTVGNLFAALGDAEQEFSAQIYNDTTKEIIAVIQKMIALSAPDVEEKQKKNMIGRYKNEFKRAFLKHYEKVFGVKVIVNTIPENIAGYINYFNTTLDQLLQKWIGQEI